MAPNAKILFPHGVTEQHSVLSSSPLPADATAPRYLGFATARLSQAVSALLTETLTALGFLS